MKHVVIIGCGFAGINAAKVLGNKEGLAVTLIDRNKLFVFLQWIFTYLSFRKGARLIINRY